MSTHKALVYREYGPPEQLTLEDVELPTPADNQVLCLLYTSPSPRD